MKFHSRCSVSDLSLFMSAILVMGLSACGPVVQFDQITSKTSSLGTGGGGGGGGSDPTALAAQDQFTQPSALSNKVDILFVDDNSGSMEDEQEAMASRLGTFIQSISSLDWQIGVTTTDVSNGPFGLRGSLIELPGGSGQRILTPTHPDAVTVFSDLIRRPETINCQATNTCPSGDEQPLAATLLAMEKRDHENRGFFRDEASLAVVVLSDEDEKSGTGTDVTTANSVLKYAATVWGQKKNITGYAIIIEPNDQTCFDLQKAQTGATATFGAAIAQLPLLTGGLTGSICENDYSRNLKRIGEHVAKAINSFSLSHIPIPGTIEVTTTPGACPKWTVEGNKLIFDSAPAPGTDITVKYKYQ